MHLAGLLIAGGVYWYVVGRVSGVSEPWDANAYWSFWWPLSLVLAGIAGFLLGRRGWAAGAILTFAQLPVMWIDAGDAALWMVAVPMLGLLAIPAVALSTLAGRVGARVRRSRLR